MPRRRYIALVAVAGIVAGAALIAWLNRPRDEPARATVGDAVRSFRAGAEGGRHEVGPGKPALGVYRYATRGAESAKTALGGTSHDYTGVSTIVLSAGPCGERERWQVLEGRWTEAESCADPAGRERGKVTEFHEFFGVAQEDSFRCSGASAPALEDLRPGVGFSNACESDGSSISNDAKVAGFETVSVGGKAFPAVRIVSLSRLDGETSGTARREDWRRRSDGLLLRRTATSVADASAAGTDTHYSESYAIRLLDPEPRR